jgi:hypothetical protein
MFGVVRFISGPTQSASLRLGAPAPFFGDAAPSGLDPFAIPMR